MSLANTKQSVGSLLLDFLKYNTEAACMRPEIYNKQGFFSKPALLELPQKRRWSDWDMHSVICTSLASICFSLT